MRAVAVIPARMGSTRVPGKVMTDVRGEPLVVHVWRRAMAASMISEVWVATDSEAVAQAVRAVGGRVIWTEDHYTCGTERVAATLNGISADIILNVQSDCAFIEPSTLDRVVDAFNDPERRFVTAVAAFPEERDPAETSIVKAVVGERGQALYFSRRPIPTGGPWLQHIGVYGFRRAALRQFVEWGPSKLEHSEQLEQLRILENGESIFTVMVEKAGLSIDTPDDLVRLSTTSIDSPSNTPRL